MRPQAAHRPTRIADTCAAFGAHAARAAPYTRSHSKRLMLGFAAEFDADQRPTALKAHHILRVAEHLDAEALRNLTCPGIDHRGNDDHAICLTRMAVLVKAYLPLLYIGFGQNLRTAISRQRRP